VSGLRLKYSGWTGKISRLGDPPASIMLQLVPERKTALKNRAHLDFLVEDAAAAVAQVIDLGGSVVREPGLL
jgi:Glyoxalase-like domain